jgi:polyferredoxin
MKRRQKLRRGILFTSFLLFPVTLYYFSPVLILEGAADGIVSGSVLVFVLLFVASLFFGRAFCGWLCPAGGLQESAAVFRDRPVRRKGIRWIKFLIWIPWLTFFLFLIMRAGGVKRIDPLWRTNSGFSVSDLPSLIIYLSIAALFFLISVIAGRRAACHSICWMAPFMIAGRKIRNMFRWPALRLCRTAADCSSCGSCNAACPMSIDVREAVLRGRLEDADCILCASCADSCPRGSITLKFSGVKGVIKDE